jgi:aspartate/methionine/tyrosine aminotransferase
LRPAKRIAGVERTLIRRIFDAAPPDAINLGLGQPDLPSPPSVSLAGIAGIARGATGYTSTAGDLALREAIATGYPGHVSGPDGILITVGSQEAMYLAGLCLLDPGDELLYPDPGYPGYEMVGRLVGADTTPYPLHRDNRFRIRAADIEKRLSERTRLVILCEPSNPTGAITEPEELKRLADLLESRGIPWVSDEIYSGYTYDRELIPIWQLAPGGGLVISGLSKDMSMTGWRIGWVAGAPETVARMTAAHQYLVTCAPRISQAAAVGAFSESGRADRERYRELFRQRRALMGRELDRIPEIGVHPPDGAFYYFVDVSRYGSSVEIASRILERCGVIVIPGEAFGESGRGFLRISFAAAEPDIREGVRRIAAELGR